MKQVLAMICIGAFLAGVSGHGRLMEPPQRSSIWRDPRFANLNLPANYDDGGLWCAGIKQDYVPTQCGVCGDPASAASPRPNENGGTYANSVIAGNYTSGQVIPISFELTATHNGYFSVQVCDDVSKESESCFWERPFLVLADGSTKVDVTSFQGMKQTTAKLPDDLSCAHCLLRIYYRTAKDWGPCDGQCVCDGQGGMGCGPQELVLNCADISVSGGARDCNGWSYVSSIGATNPFEFGTDLGGADKAYSCRTPSANDVLVGQFNTRTQECRISFNGEEYIVTENVQVIVNNGANLHFQPSDTVPARGAIEGGRLNGETLYVVRCRVTAGSQTGWLAGKFQVSTGQATGSWNGQELVCSRGDIQFLICD